jgi:hypothetical protein
MSEEAVGQLFKLEWTCPAFFGPGDQGFVHWDDCWLVSRLNLWIHVEFPVIIFRRNSGSVLSLSLKSCHMLRQLSYCFSLTSGVCVGGKPAHLTLSLTVCRTGPNEVSNFMDSDSSVFEDKLLCSVHFFTCYACYTCREFDIFQRDCTTSSSKKSLILWHLKVSVEFYPSLQHSVMRTYILGMQKL